ncbi:hypothetical protein RUND412_010342 [Rhizina undulata]
MDLHNTIFTNQAPENDGRSVNKTFPLDFPFFTNQAPEKDIAAVNASKTFRLAHNFSTLSLANGNNSSEKHGLFLLHPDPSQENSLDINVDIVAMHGLNGDPYKTWTAQNGNFWLASFLPKEIPHARIFTYGYASKAHFSDSSQKVEDFAKNLLHRLSQKRMHENEKRRPIIFICHSLGGIVIKKALILAYAAKEYADLRNSVYGIIFMGTPHQGSIVAVYASLLSTFIPVRSLIRADLLKELEPGSKSLENISYEFKHIGMSLESIVSFYETNGHLGGTVDVVPKESAITNLPNERALPFDARHGEMGKYASQDSQNYIAVLDAIHSMVDKAVHWPGRGNVPAEKLEIGHHTSKSRFKLPYLNFERRLHRYAGGIVSAALAKSTPMLELQLQLGFGLFKACATFNNIPGLQSISAISLKALEDVIRIQWAKGIKKLTETSTEGLEFLMQHGKKEIVKELLRQCLAIFHHYLEREKQIDVKAIAESGIALYLTTISMEKRELAALIAEKLVEAWQVSFESNINALAIEPVINAYRTEWLNAIKCDRKTDVLKISEGVMLALEKAIDGERNAVVQHLSGCVVSIWQESFDRADWEHTRTLLADGVRGRLTRVVDRMQKEEQEHLWKFWGELSLAAIKSDKESVLVALMGIMAEKLKLAKNGDHLEVEVTEVVRRLVDKRVSLGDKDPIAKLSFKDLAKS